MAAFGAFLDQEGDGGLLLGLGILFWRFFLLRLFTRYRFITVITIKTHAALAWNLLWVVFWHYCGSIVAWNLLWQYCRSYLVVPWLWDAVVVAMFAFTAVGSPRKVDAVHSSFCGRLFWETFNSTPGRLVVGPSYPVCPALAPVRWDHCRFSGHRCPYSAAGSCKWKIGIICVSLG